MTITIVAAPIAGIMEIPGWKPAKLVFKEPVESGESIPEHPLTELMDVLHDPDQADFAWPTFFRDPDGVSWAEVSIDGALELLPIKSPEFKTLITQRLRASLEHMPSDKLLRDTLREIEGACLDGGTKKVHLRLAENEGKIYIDLGDEQRRCVEVSADGWSVKSKAPVYFRRDETSRPLPVPKSGGNATALFDCVNLPDRAQQILVLSWLVAALRPSGPYPLLAMYGQQGSAKTTAQSFLRRLVDPSSAPLISSPRDERDLVIAAKHSHILGFDNLKSL